MRALRGRADTPVKVFVGLGAAGLAVFALASALGTERMPAGPFGLWAVWRGGVGHRATELAATSRMLGVVVLIGAWFALRYQPRRVQGWTLVVWSLVLLAIPPGRGDVYNYVEQGWLVLQGLDPTLVASGSVPGPYASWGGAWTGTTVAYPPVGLALQALVVWVSMGHAWLALVLMRVLCAAAVMAIWWLLPRVADLFGVSRQQAGWVVALNPMIWVHGVAGVHLDLVAVALAAAALWVVAPVVAGLGAAERRGITSSAALRGVVALVLALLAVGVKPPVALLLCCLVPLTMSRATIAQGAPWRQRQLAEAVGCALVVAGLVGAVAVLSRLSPFGAHWTQATGDPAWASSSLWSTFADVAPRAGVRLATLFEALAPQALVWCSVAAVLVLLVAVLTVRLPDAAMIGALTLLMVCTIGPAGRPWYLLPAVLGLGLVRWDVTRQAVVTVLVLVAFSGEMFGTMSYLGRQTWSWGLALCLAVAAWSIRASVPGRARLNDATSEGVSS